MRWEALTQGEWTHFLPIDDDCTDQLVLLQHWHGEHCPCTAERSNVRAAGLCGRIPVRGSSDGGTPVPGWTGEYEWTGSVAPQSLPVMRDPPSGQIVTANNEIDRRWPKTMTRDWASPFRSMRIAQMLGTRTGLTQDDMRAMQLDVQSAEAEPFLAAVEAARKSPRLRRPSLRRGSASSACGLIGKSMSAGGGASIRACAVARSPTRWTRTCSRSSSARGCWRYAGIDQIMTTDLALVERHRDGRQGDATTSCCWRLPMP